MEEHAMSCGALRKAMYLADRLEALSPERIRAAEHLQGCSACQAFFASEEALKSVLRNRSPRRQAPPHLREAVLEQIAQEMAREVPSALNPRRLARVLVFTLVAGLGLLAAWIGYQQYPKDHEDRLVTELVEDHVRYRPGASEITSSNVEEVQAWFQGKVDFAVQPPRLAQAELLGGRVCYLSGRKGVLLSYQRQGTLISFYIIEGTDLTLSGFRHQDSQTSDFVGAGDKGHSLILWTDRGLVYALVSDLPESELVRLATSVRQG